MWPKELNEHSVCCLWVWGLQRKRPPKGCSEKQVKTPLFHAKNLGFSTRGGNIRQEKLAKIFAWQTPCLVRRWWAPGLWSHVTGDSSFVILPSCLFKKGEILIGIKLALHLFNSGFWTRISRFCFSYDKSMRSGPFFVPRYCASESLLEDVRLFPIIQTHHV